MSRRKREEDKLENKKLNFPIMTNEYWLASLICGHVAFLVSSESIKISLVLYQNYARLIGGQLETALRRGSNRLFENFFKETLSLAQRFHIFTELKRPILPRLIHETVSIDSQWQEQTMSVFKEFKNTAFAQIQIGAALEYLIRNYDKYDKEDWLEKADRCFDLLDEKSANKTYFLDSKHESQILTFLMIKEMYERRVNLIFLFSKCIQKVLKHATLKHKLISLTDTCRYLQSPQITASSDSELNELISHLDSHHRDDFLDHLRKNKESTTLLINTLISYKAAGLEKLLSVSYIDIFPWRQRFIMDEKCHTTTREKVLQETKGLGLQSWIMAMPANAKWQLSTNRRSVLSLYLLGHYSNAFLDFMNSFADLCTKTDKMDKSWLLYHKHFFDLFQDEALDERKLVSSEVENEFVLECNSNIPAFEEALKNFLLIKDSVWQDQFKKKYESIYKELCSYCFSCFPASIGSLIFEYGCFGNLYSAPPPSPDTVTTDQQDGDFSMNGSLSIFQQRAQTPASTTFLPHGKSM